MRRREPPTPCGRGPSRRGGRSPGTGGRCGPFDTVIHHPVPPPQSPARRPPRQLPVSAVKARQCPRLRPSAPRPCTFGHHAPPGRSSETVIGGAGTRQLTAAGPRKWHSGVTRRNPLPKGRAAGGVMGHPLTPARCQMSCHAGSVSDTAGGALTPCPAPEAGPAGSAGTVEGLGPKKRAPPSRSQKDRRMRSVPRGPIRGPGWQPGGKEAGPKRGPTRARADGRTLGGKRSERARVRVQHEAGGEDGRPAGGRQAVCWPGSRTWRDEESGVLCAGPPAASKAVTGAESDRTPRPCRTAGGQRQQDGRRQRRDADGRYGSSR